jgi:hypothetical protein
LAIGFCIAVATNFIGDVFRFVSASLFPNPAAELLVGRVVYLPRVITVHKAEKNFVKKQMVDPFCRGQRAGHIFGLIIGYWLLDIGYWISSLLVAPEMSNRL